MPTGMGVWANRHEGQERGSGIPEQGRGEGTPAAPCTAVSAQHEVGGDWTSPPSPGWRVGRAQINTSTLLPGMGQRTSLPPAETCGPAGRCTGITSQMSTVCGAHGAPRSPGAAASPTPAEPDAPPGTGWPQRSTVQFT